MDKKEMMIKAHKMTKEIKTEYAEVNYSFQLGLCMSYLAKEGEKKEMVELQGSEKQVAWAENIRATTIEKFETGVKNVEGWKENHLEKIEKIRMELNNNTSSIWFIDNFKTEKMFFNFFNDQGIYGRKLLKGLNKEA
ncbi:hypothetical protein LGL08_20655 [Clostridium estertheticum]|uniref:hypothetical protein n=1 Tax=Clostridium estertheticum TaxID=238834 RepID=UPI001CF52D16|nr:hypothetical protein [Clostridium estertheticum]MCB2308880.1 hypothetical protein [Clostridium estertheticum]MCB2347292.1 hypothetical protein [Clostridium estertheticum]MCB2351941.1 hypothetical protein [Clostridium estertheticum]WAG48494.1 hypothetical protein LL127_23525 [Clostridium estertheticum]